MTELPEEQFEVAGRQITTIVDIPIYVGLGVLFAMVYGMLPKIGHGPVVALFTALAILASIVVHEAAHAIAARLRGLPIHLISFGLGAFVLIGPGVTHHQIGARVCAAGALANLALATSLVAASAALNLGGLSKDLVEAAMQVNLLLGVSNLLPIYGLDGGIIACLLLGRIIPWRWALTIVGSIGLVFEAIGTVMPIALLIIGWPLTWDVCYRSIALLRWAWRKPPPPLPLGRLASQWAGARLADQTFACKGEREDLHYDRHDRVRSPDRPPWPLREHSPTAAI